jgi:hypothetical protein
MVWSASPYIEDMIQADGYPVFWSIDVPAGFGSASSLTTVTTHPGYNKLSGPTPPGARYILAVVSRGTSTVGADASGPQYPASSPYVAAYLRDVFIDSGQLIGSDSEPARLAGITAVLRLALRYAGSDYAMLVQADQSPEQVRRFPAAGTANSAITRVFCVPGRLQDPAGSLLPITIVANKHPLS